MTMSDQNMETNDAVDLAELDMSSRVTAYALGQLEPRERAEFERRMTEDPQLAGLVEEELAFAASMRTALPSGMPRAEAFDALELSEAPRQRIFQYGLAAAVAILGLGLLLSMPAPKPAFETLSSGSGAAVSQGFSYRMVLTGEAAADARDWLAKDYQLSVVSGVDTVLVLSREEPLSASELKTLRSHPAVALLEQQVAE